MFFSRHFLTIPRGIYDKSNWVQDPTGIIPAGIMRYIYEGDVKTRAPATAKLRGLVSCRHGQWQGPSSGMGAGVAACDSTGSIGQLQIIRSGGVA